MGDEKEIWALQEEIWTLQVWATPEKGFASLGRRAKAPATSDLARQGWATTAGPVRRWAEAPGPQIWLTGVGQRLPALCDAVLRSSELGLHCYCSGDSRSAVEL